MNLENARECIASLLPHAVEVEAGVPGDPAHSIHPQEGEVVAGAAEVRRIEFAAGRDLARTALRRLGVDGHALLPAKDRSPQWPAGVVGSISHTRTLCGVVAARRSAVASLGLDIESEEGLAPELWERILGARELAWLEAAAEAERSRIAMLVFSAKECFYKCQYPLTERFLGFHDVELELDLASRRFVAKPIVDLGLPGPPHFEGHWNHAEEHVITAMALQPR